MTYDEKVMLLAKQIHEIGMYYHEYAAFEDGMFKICVDVATKYLAAIGITEESS